MKIDVGEGTRGAGGAEDLRGGAAGGGYGVGRSSNSADRDSGVNRAVVQASGGSVLGEEPRRGAEGVGATVRSCVPGVEAGGAGGGAPHSNNKHRPLAAVALAVVHGRGNTSGADGGSGEYQEADKTTAPATTTSNTTTPTTATTATAKTTTLAHLGLKRSKLAPPEERLPDGVGTPPTDAGGDPCPSCASFTRVPSTATGPDYCPCRCARAHAGDIVPGGFTGGEPVASADAVAVDAGGGGSGGADIRGGGGRRGVREGIVVAPEARMEGGRGGGGGGVPSEAARTAHEADEALLGTVAFQEKLRQLEEQRLQLRRQQQQQQRQRQQQQQEQQQQQQQQQQQRQQQQRQRQLVQQERRKRLDPRLSMVKAAKQAAAAASDGARVMVGDVGATSCPKGAAEKGTGTARTECSKEDTGEQEVGVSQEDTMDRLAQSLAQAEQLAISVEARQTELLARPKRRSHPSAKQKAAQSRKVRPKSMPQSKPPKLEELGVKVEPGTAAPATATGSATPVPSAATAASNATAAAPASLLPKQRLLIKIPRSAVTAATAHAAEVAAAAAAAEAAEASLAVRATATVAATAVKVKEEATDVRVSKRGKGKSGVKRARPLAGTRTSPPPPPPPAPTSRQELPPGCGPPCPSLTGIFGREMDEEELEGAEDGVEHLQTSQASRRLTALSAAAPSELASHVQALRLDYLVQKVRPILTKLMSAGTGPQRGLFNVPVDPIKLGIPDYFRRVDHPMDLGTIKSRLLSMTYTTPEAFASDVRLVFNNAISFNPESHFVHTWAVQLLNEFDQEYSKQIGKLDEGWARSLSHSCQLCQGQTCVLCGDKCLKLEPPVIICHHCNKRVVRGGVYHITRDGCRLWCSRCHPGLPPELPTDGDPEGIGAEDADGAVVAAAGANGNPSVDGAGSVVGGAGDGTAPAGASDARAQSSQPPPPGASGGGGDGGGVIDQGVSAAAAATVPAEVVSSSASPKPEVSSLSPPPPPAPVSAAGVTVTATVTALASQPSRVSSPSPAAGGGVDCGGAENERTGDVSGEAPAAAVAAAAAGAAAADTTGRAAAPVAPAAIAIASETGRGSPGGRDVAGALGTEEKAVAGGEEAEAVEEVKAPLKRDLLRRKFDEEISEPWVQCDRCNSWVHQVCALFNARANVGEARFVCPLCRLRTVVTKSTILGAAATAAEDSTKPRKRPKSIDGSGKLLSPCPVKPKGASEAAATAAAAAGAAAAVEVAEPGATASLAAFSVKMEHADTGGGVGVSPMEGVVASTLTPTPAESKEVGTSSGAAAVVSSCATPLEERPVPPDCSPPPPAHAPSSSTTPSLLFRPIAPAPASGEGGALSSAGVKLEGGVVDESGGGDGGAGAGRSGGGGCDVAVGGSGVEVPLTSGSAAAQGVATAASLGKAEGADAAAVAAAAAAATKEVAANGTATARLAAATVAASTAAAVAAVAAATAAKREGGTRDSMEVEEDVGAEAAGDASCGSAASDNFDVYAASSLPHTPLSRYIEWRVRQRLTSLENEKAAATLSIRLISNVEATCEVHAVLRETFCCKDGHGVGPNKNDVPELLKYRSKALSMFQRVDGVEVCLFSMYVQEYGADAPYFNARRAYISYLDSVEYFRPRKHRTAVYHEILVAYLDWIRRRGFKAAHIWSCPPQRGNNFIFWCHPLHQKTPTRDRLSGWYGNMLKRAVHLGVAAKVTTLDKTHFAEVERIGILLKNRRTSAAASAAASLAGVKGPDDLPLRPEVPVIFEGDFWAEEAVRLARAVDRRDDGGEDSQSPLELCRQALEELIRHQQGAPFAAPVDPARDRCPDYLAVIEQPMDLGTVAETLDAMKYHDAGAFVADVRLVFDNARRYNPPKHPIHVAACKLAKVFDKTVRALESAVNRLPGMHEMGLEHLLLEEPIPPAPATPTSSAAVASPAGTPAAAGGAGATGAPPRPTAPGKRSIPWAYDAIGPLSQLARQTWAAHNTRSARTVGTLPSMREGSAVEVGLPAGVPLFRSQSSGLGGAGEASFDYGSSGPVVDKLSRSGSTSVMSVSEFYGPSGARMLQRRESTASQVSLADSYGEGEAAESVSAVREESREGTAALTLLMADDGASEGGGQPPPPPGDAAGAAVSGGGGVRGGETPLPSPRTATPEATSASACPPLAWPKQGQADAAAAAAGGASGEASEQVAAVVTSPPGANAAAAARTPSPAALERESGEKSQAEGSSSPPKPAEEVAATTADSAVRMAAAAAVGAPEGAGGAAASHNGSASPLPGGARGGVPGGVRTLLPPPPLTLECPHPCARAGGSANTPTGHRRRPSGGPSVSSGGSVGGEGPPASSMSLSWGSAVRDSLADGAQKKTQNQNQRVGLPRAMSVDSAPASARAFPRSLSIGTQGAEVSAGSEAFEITAGGSSDVNGGGGGGGGGGGVSNSSAARSTSGGLHSPRLRAKSMDSSGRKGKSKRGKGPGAAVMGKADRIGRMLQSLSRAVTRISKDLLVVTLGKPDQPAKPPPARSGSGTTTEAMLKELQTWHASSGLDGALTPDCHDPDPPISRALVDARHTFLEMCQFRHYQFDTLRRAKHSSAMVLYHLHRPESRSLNPFCSRCHRPVRYVRYHCGVCNYDLCAECDEDVGTKCEDGHPLTPYRVTFSTEDAEKSPAAGFTPATGGTSLSPLRSPGGARTDTTAAAGEVASALALDGGGGGGSGSVANATEVPRAHLTSNGGGGGGGERQQQQQVPRMRDSREGEGGGGGPDERGGAVVAMDEDGTSAGSTAHNPASLGRPSTPLSLPSLSLSPPASTAEGVPRETEGWARAATGAGGPDATALGEGGEGFASAQAAPVVDVGGGESQTAAVGAEAAAVASRKSP